mmetsp:Transcript_20142/g.56790  ORF Transcript_20142/g.56790 Transcript_20142/m.56790 type:complete len:245 (-) Transcript_20142:3-737(-)
MRATLQAARVCRIPGNVARPNPSLFYYPGLNSRPWYDIDSSPQFGWVRKLEALTPHIAAEYCAMRNAPGGLPPSDYEASASDHGSDLYQGQQSWHWASFIDRGHLRPGMAEQCPMTASALLSVPRLCVDSMPFAFTFFSTLRGGSHIAPHCSPCNLRIRVHLPLIVPDPEACGMKVAGETRRWEEGKALIFDDAYEHEVWNDGDSDRVILLIDTWHPDLTHEEVRALQSMFAEVQRMSDERKGT